jgi:hypothetical protein
LFLGFPGQLVTMKLFSFCILIIIDLYKWYFSTFFKDFGILVLFFHSVFEDFSTISGRSGHGRNLDPLAPIQYQQPNCTLLCPEPSPVPPGPVFGTCFEWSNHDILRWYIYICTVIMYIMFSDVCSI